MIQKAWIIRNCYSQIVGRKSGYSTHNNAMRAVNQPRINAELFELAQSQPSARKIVYSIQLENIPN